MPHIQTIILGNPNVDSVTNKARVTLAATFYDYVDTRDVTLSVITSEGESIINGEAKDAVESYPDNQSSSSANAMPLSTYARHIHFQIDNLIPGDSFTYELKTSDPNEFITEPAIKPNTPSLKHQSVTLRAPLAPDDDQAIKIAFGADQEVMDILRACKADDKLAKILGLNFDQSTLTAQLYQIIAQSKPDLFIHGGDLMFGENLVPYKMVKTLSDFREHIEADFHQLVGTALKGIYAARVLDDHDFGRNGVSNQDVKDDPHAIENAINAFNEFFPNPLTDEDGNRGLFGRIRFGQTEIWLLNNRYYHLDSQTLLGQAQFDWLKSTLAASDAAVKLVVTPLPLVMGKKPGEDYRGNADAWFELVNLLFEHRVNGVLSADIHARSRTDLVREKDGVRQTMFQVISGTLGGRPQCISKAERKKLPLPLLPEGLTEEQAEMFKHSLVHTYYTPVKRPTDIPLLGDVSILPFGKKSKRVYDVDQGWVGEKYASGKYGYESIQIDPRNNRITIDYIAHGEDSKKPFYIDHAEYLINPMVEDTLSVEEQALLVSSHSAVTPQKISKAKQSSKLESNQETNSAINPKEKQKKKTQPQYG